MTLSQILSSLENSWKRDEILIKINKGLDSDEIVNEFLINNQEQIKKLNNLLKKEDIDLLNEVEQLSICEAKLINKINNFNSLKTYKNYRTKNKKRILLTKTFPANKISKFMINWSNKFVVITLLIISAIALSKQAWL